MPETLPPEVRANEKIDRGVDWRGTVEIELGDETVEYTHRLLNESETMRVRQALDTEAAASVDDEAVDAEKRERLAELQQREELDEDEKEELREIVADLAGDDEALQDALGEDGLYLLMEMGQNTIEPSDEYVEWVLDQPPSDQAEILGVDEDELGGFTPTDRVRTELRRTLRDKIDGQPFPIKIQIGMSAFAETMSVLGNGFQT